MFKCLAKATNGILQGCLLLVIFINILTTVWKREIDTLQNAFYVEVRNLPPRSLQCPARPARRTVQRDGSEPGSVRGWLLTKPAPTTRSGGLVDTGMCTPAPRPSTCSPVCSTGKVGSNIVEDDVLSDLPWEGTPPRSPSPHSPACPAGSLA